MPTDPLYHILIQATASKLPTILSALDGEVTLVKVEPAPDPTAKPKYRYTGGKRYKGIEGKDLVLQTMTEPRPYTKEELSAIFIEKGFASNSVSPNLSRLVKEGKLVTLGQGKYALRGVPLATSSQPIGGGFNAKAVRSNKG